MNEEVKKRVDVLRDWRAQRPCPERGKNWELWRALQRDEGERTEIKTKRGSEKGTTK